MIGQSANTGNGFANTALSNLSSVAINTALLPNADNTIDLGSMGDYLPMNAADGLLTFPDNPLKGLARGVMPTDYTSIVMTLSVAYLLLFCWWSFNRIVKTDL